MTLPEVSIDFEFRSGTDIDLGLPAYFADAEAAPLCLVFDLDEGLGGVLWTPDQPGDIELLLDHVRAGGIVRGWNVMFEWHVWNLVMVPQFGWPELRIDQLRCTMAEAQAMNLPAGLAKAAVALQLPVEEQKDKRGKELIRLLCIPQAEPEVKPRAHYKTEGAYKGALTRHKSWQAKGGRWRNDPELLQELYEYCRQDVVTEKAIKRRVRRLAVTEQRVWEMTQAINLRGVPIDVSDIEHISAVVDAELDYLNSELRDLTDGEINAASEVGALRDWINAQLAEPERLPDMAAETIDAALLHAQQAPELFAPRVVRALQIRAAIGQTSTAKLPKMLRVCAPDGTLKNMHVYHGASTGRDASRGGVNLQNLKSPVVEDIESAITVLTTGDHELARMVYGDSLMDAAVSCVRGVIKAPPGQEFTDGDFSSVENRVSAFIAGQHDKLDLFRKGLDEYRTFAVKIFNIDYEAVSKAQRKFAKPAVLGGMFGQGAVGLVGYAAGMGVHLDLARSEELTKLYRQEYDKVQACWYACGRASILAVRSPGQSFAVGDKLRLVVHNNFLWMQLPSGRLIAWAAPRIEEQETPWGEIRPVVTVTQVDAFTHKWKRDKLIGSSIFQSAVQATARDLLMHAMFNVEGAGYRVVLRVHDELLSCNPVGFGSCEEYGSLMCQAPHWARDLPLAFEAWRGPRFRK